MMWVESNFIYEYTYDDNGVLIRVVGKGNHATETTEYSYDADGNLVNESITLKVSGAKQFSSKSYFYENGILVRIEENSEQNGLVVITYTYGDYYCYTPEN
jgi:YD repeat-containing protein